MRWSRLFPHDWRQEFGDEFDDTLAKARPGLRTALDVLWAAAKAHRLPTLVVLWAGAAFFNVAASEVQWCAGWLLASGAVLGWLGPRQAAGRALIVFSAVPLSSLVAGVSPGHPVYETLVALVPLGVGVVVGSALLAAFPPKRTRGA